MHGIEVPDCDVARVKDEIDEVRGFQAHSSQVLIQRRMLHDASRDRKRKFSEFVAAGVDFDGAIFFTMTVDRDRCLEV